LKKNIIGGWEWYDVNVHPSVLSNLVRKEILKIVYKSRSYTHYRLNREIKDLLFECEHKPVHEMDYIYNNEAKKIYFSIPQDLFDCIVGYEDIKEFLKTILRLDDPIHVLFVGPPATAKSLFLMELERIGNSAFITGGGSTKVGIMDILFDMRPKILIIDEIDKIQNPKDLSALLTYMETGRVIRAKHNTYEEIINKGFVFAACNTTKNIPFELLDRFQIFYLREYSREDFILVVIKLLNKNYEIDENLAKYIAEKVFLYSNSIREVMRIGKIVKKKEDVDRLISLFTRYSS